MNKFWKTCLCVLGVSLCTALVNVILPHITNSSIPNFGWQVVLMVEGGLMWMIYDSLN